MLRISTLSIAALAIAVCANSAKAVSPDKIVGVIDQFVASLENNGEIAADKKVPIIQTVKEMRDDAYDRPLAITEALCEIYPDYAKSLELMGEEDLRPAIQSLASLSKSSDAYLAAEATFYLARAYMLDERYEEAIPLLRRVSSELSEQTVQTGNALYLEGIANARLLNRKEAIAALERYINENPNAPERMQVGAWRQLEQLRSLKEGTLADVYDRMDFSRRHLKLAKTGDETQEQQDQIIAMLDKLIKEAEDRESQASQSESECKKCGKKDCQGDCEGEGEGEGKGKGKGGNSKNEDGVARKTYNNGPQSPWSKLRDRDRDPVYSAIKERFPARFEHIIEQYYKSFQTGAEE